MTRTSRERITIAALFVVVSLGLAAAGAFVNGTLTQFVSRVIR